MSKDTSIELSQEGAKNKPHDLEICPECAIRLPEELISKLKKGKEIVCERCGATYKIPPLKKGRESQDNSPRKYSVVPPTYPKITQIRASKNSPPKKYSSITLFFNKIKFALRRFYYRLLDKLRRPPRARGRGKRRRGRRR